MLGTDLVLFLALWARLASLSVAVLTYCLLVGMVASLVEGVFGDAPRSTASSGCSSPFGLRLVSRLARPPRLLLLELFASFRFRLAAFTGLLFCSSCACLVSSGTAASRMFESGLALSGLGGCSPLGVLPPRFPLGCLLPLWVASAAAWGLASHFFPLPFPLESLSLHGSWSGFCRGSSLRVVSSCSFLEGVLPPLWRWRIWMVESSMARTFFGTFPWCLFASILFPLALHGVVSTSPVCLSRAPAFRQVRVAMLAEGSVESPSVLVLAFHSSLFLVEGSSDGSAAGVRSSPLDGCVYSLRFWLRSVASALSLLGSWAFLPPLSVSLLSDVVAPFLEETGRSSRRFYVFQSSTWWSSV